MNCELCEKDSPIYATHKLCCAVRFVMRDCHGSDEEVREMRTKTAELYQLRYGFTREQMLAERERQRGWKK